LSYDSRTASARGRGWRQEGGAARFCGVAVGAAAADALGRRLPGRLGV